MVEFRPIALGRFLIRVSRALFAIVAAALLCSCSCSSPNNGKPSNDGAVGLDGSPYDVVPDAGLDAQFGPDSDTNAGPEAGGDMLDGGMDGETGMSEAGLPGHPVSKYCGDAIRDPVKEECDDGLGASLDVCTPDCRVRDVPLLSSSSPDDSDAAVSKVPKRLLGTGPHVASGLETGFAAVYVEYSGGVSVRMQIFDEVGGRKGLPIDVSANDEPVQEANPVVAALPDNRYAVAWTDGRLGTPDVRVRVVDAADGTKGSAITAHESTAGFQQDPDLLWTGSELIVAWTDLLDVKYRIFDDQLQPLGNEHYLASSGAIESSVTLARFGKGWAAAFRANNAGLDVIKVVAGRFSWTTQADQPGPTGDRPALVALDDKHLLLLFTRGTDPLATGSPSVGRLRVALLSTASPGTVTATDWTPLLSPYSSDETLAQRRPSAARAGDIAYVAWQSESPAGSSLSDEVFVARVDFDAKNDSLIQQAEMALPLGQSRDGAQQNPRVGVSELFPYGALITLWEDAGAASGNLEPELMIDFRPSPFVTLPASAAMQ